MSRSLNSYQKNVIKKSQGCICAFCGSKREKKFLEVHHINLLEHDNRKENLILLCGNYTDSRCHKKIHSKLSFADGVDKELLIELTPKFLGGEREKEKKSKIIIKEEVDYQTGSSAEMKVNDFAEFPFRNWIVAKIRSSANQRILKNEAINGGAEKNDVSPTTTRKYLQKMTSEEGELEEFKCATSRKKFIRFKEQKNYLGEII